MANQPLNGRVALITGGGGEIATAIALRYAREGARVAVCDLQGAKAEATAALLRAEGFEAVGFACDVSVPEDAARAVAETVKTHGALHILVNVAAAATPDGTVETLTLDQWNRAMAVNLGGPFLMCKYAVPEIRRAGGGAIVNIASQLGHLGAPGRSPYCSSKAGLLRFTQILAMDHATDNIRVNGVAPATVLTPSREILLSDPQRRQKMLERLPQKRFPTPEDIAGAVSYLANPETLAVTGHILPVDAGLLAV